MTWGNDPKVVETILKMMRGSWEACVNYEMPLGLHHIMEAGGHYDPKPATVNRKSPEYSAWHYHKADADGIGFDRTRSGSDATSQYAPAIRDRFESLETCPPELLLWFHHVPWDFRTRTGRTVWEELCFRYIDGARYVKQMQAEWDSLRGTVDPQRFAAVQRRLQQQLKHAENWRNTCLRYFQSVNGRKFPDFISFQKESTGSAEAGESRSGLESGRAVPAG
jgi:alpha-glucuronidase